MTKTGLISALAMSLVSSPALAAPDDCAVLDELLLKARTDFTALKDENFGGARCFYRGKEYKCVWPFGTDSYDQAGTQLERLQRCTADQPHAQLLEKKAHQALFQLNPETTMALRGPDPENGHWTIQLRITTSADWH